MEGLFQPFHIFLTLLILLVTLGPPYAGFRIARRRRARCTWSLAQARRRLWLGVVLIVLPPLSLAVLYASMVTSVGAMTFDFSHMLFMEILWIPCDSVFWAAGAYQIAKAVFRRRDIHGAELGASS